MSKFLLLNGDCLKEMKKIPPKSVDLVLCDLPYDQTTCSWDSIIPFEPLWKQYKRIAKEDATFLFTAKGQFMISLIESNIDWFRYHWVWDKNKAANFANAKKWPLMAHEFILVFFNKDRHKITNTDKIVRVISQAQTGLLHPTQKPIFLMDHFIKQYSKKNDVVLDNCMGSGTTGVAAIKNCRKFVGIEKDEKYFNIAKSRIESIPKPLF